MIAPIVARCIAKVLPRLTGGWTYRGVPGEAVAAMKVKGVSPMRPRSSVDRAVAFQASGRGFDSRRGYVHPETEGPGYPGPQRLPSKLIYTPFGVDSSLAA